MGEGGGGRGGGGGEVCGMRYELRDRNRDRRTCQMYDREVERSTLS